MCGILCAIQCAPPPAHNVVGHEGPSTFANLCTRLKTANTARGPDAQRSRNIFIPRNKDESIAQDEPEPNCSHGLALEFFASELRLRGDAPIVQPHELEGDIFCWNGEVFEGLEIDASENDGVKVFTAMRKLTDSKDLITLFGSIEGPYAFVYYHSASQQIYFARDPLGRRSLLIHKPSTTNPYFILTSVTVGVDPRYDMEEIPSGGIFRLDVGRLSSRNIINDFDSCLTHLPFVSDPRSEVTLPFASLPRVNLTLPPDGLPYLKSLDDGFQEHMLEPVKRLISHLDRSVMLRVQNIPQSATESGQARVAVLFSGGIDSTMLAFLAHRHVPIGEPIDLLNVAFENPRKLHSEVHVNTKASAKKQSKRCLNDMATVHEMSIGDNAYMVPDRLSGLKELEELRRVCPKRVWNFVEMDISYKESQATRPTVEAIMFPGRTVMDLSLALALYFASRGQGRVRDEACAELFRPYTSPARVLLDGLGADELLGGYGRHRTAFNVRGWGGVIHELQLDLDRLPTRNLGRDDRIISSHGKEARFPFLSLSVVAFLASLPVHIKLYGNAGIGVGDKMLLRCAARKLGLVEASERHKRAMQFGTHSARMERGPGQMKGNLLLDD